MKAAFKAGICVSDLVATATEGEKLGSVIVPICHIPVALNRLGVIQLGGLNPVVAAVEAGIEIENIAESGLIDFQELRCFWEL